MKIGKFTNTMLAIGVAATSFAQTAVKDTAKITHIRPNTLQRVDKKDVFRPITKEVYFQNFVSSDTLSLTCPCGDSTISEKAVIKVGKFGHKGDTLNTAYFNVVGDKEVYEVTGADTSRIILKNLYGKLSMQPHKTVLSVLKKQGVFLPENLKIDELRLHEQTEKSLDSLAKAKKKATSSIQKKSANAQMRNLSENTECEISHNRNALFEQYENQPLHYAKINENY